MNRIDLTMDDMANNKFLTTYSALIKYYTQNTEFTQTEVVCLLIVYYKFVRMNGPSAKQMYKKQMYNLFLVMFRIFDIQIIERILLNLTLDVTYISPEAWMHLFSIFTTKNLNERIQFAYKVKTRIHVISFTLVLILMQNIYILLLIRLYLNIAFSEITLSRSIQHLQLEFSIGNLSDWL